MSASFTVRGPRAGLSGGLHFLAQAIGRLVTADVAVLLAVVLTLIGLGLAYRFARPPLVMPAVELRTTTLDPDSLPGGPVFYAGPLQGMHGLAQDVIVREPVAAIRVWIQPVNPSEPVRARVEIRDQSNGQVLRRLNLEVTAREGPFLLGLQPPLHPYELRDEGRARVLLTGRPAGAGVRVGMTLGDRYPHGGSHIGGEPNWPDQDLHFETLRVFTARADLGAVLDRMTGSAAAQRFSLIAVAVIAGGVAAAWVLRGRLSPPLAAAAALVALAVGGVMALAFTFNELRWLGGPGLPLDGWLVAL